MVEKEVVSTWKNMIGSIRMGFLWTWVEHVPYGLEIHKIWKIFSYWNKVKIITKTKTKIEFDFSQKK